jgi:hypothetical protein
MNDVEHGPVYSGRKTLMEDLRKQDQMPELKPGQILELPPVDMILFCPNCGLQHVDMPTAEWDNPPHRSHLCHGCTHVWRPSDTATNGVSEIQTQGRNDSPIHRGRARCVTNEQRRIEQLIQAADWAGPRLTAIRDALLRNIRHRG